MVIQIIGRTVLATQLQEMLGKTVLACSERNEFEITDGGTEELDSLREEGFKVARLT